MMANNKIFLLLLVALLPFACATKQDEEFLYDTFPEGFKWGVATSAYQIEGAWNVDGKGPHNWDIWSHENDGENVAEGHNGDVACDSYHKYPQDTALIKNMGANFYRFSLSWARIVPTGKISDGINQRGIDHYNAVIDNLLANGIEPFITLYHWDTPMKLVDEGSWLNETIVDHFRDYARIAFRSFGDRVKLWLSFNEPHVFCPSDWSYLDHDFYLEKPPVKPYVCAHNVIKSHALAWRVYDEEFRPVQNGQMGITLNCDWPEPNVDDAAHNAASDRSMHFHYGWWANVLTRGEYPPIMRELIDAKSAAEGRNESRLPSFDEKWTQTVNGTLDFLGLNHYFSYNVEPLRSNDTDNWLNADGDISVAPDDDDWEHTATGWPITPFGLRKVITWIYKEYGMPIYITENGYGGWANDTIEDPIRVDFYKNYVNNVLKSIKLDGSDVRSYTAWTLIDNLEWASGYTIRFGVHYVNYTDINLPRTPKASALYLKQMFADNGFPEPRKD